MKNSTMEKPFSSEDVFRATAAPPQPPPPHPHGIIKMESRVRACMVGYERAVALVDTLDGRTGGKIYSLPEILINIEHFLTHDCMFALPLLIHLNYVMRVSRDALALSQIATLLCSLIPDLWTRWWCSPSCKSERPNT